jgi:FkbM family methyltransferase
MLTRSLNYAGVWRGYSRVWNFEIFHPSADRWLYLMLHKTGLMGTSERSHLEALVRPGMTVFDIGANIGLYTHLLASLTGPGGHVYSLEPVPVLHDSIRRSLEKNRLENVTLFNAAAGSENGPVALQAHGFNSGDNRLVAGSAGNAGSGSQTITSRRIDDLLPDFSPDFIKIDVQGWETEAFRGMPLKLARRPAPLILCEVWREGLEMASTSVEEMLGLLASHGYRFFLPGRINGRRREFNEATIASVCEKANRGGYFDVVASVDSLRP